MIAKIPFSQFTVNLCYWQVRPQTFLHIYSSGFLEVLLTKFQNSVAMQKLYIRFFVSNVD